MDATKQVQKKKVPQKKSNNTLFIVVLSVVVLIAVTLIIKAAFSGEDKSTGGDTSAVVGENLLIPKSEVSEVAKFYPTKAGNTKMEVLAVKASDGSIRTAFNTCQVCYDSGRGYYVQEGDELVCQNCGNRFQIDQVEVIKGGCNPVPIFEKDKTDDGTNLIIPKELIAQNKNLFSRWKTR